MNKSCPWEDKDVEHCNVMHERLAKQLQELGLSAERPPDSAGWQRLLNAIAQDYTQEIPANELLSALDVVDSGIVLFDPQTDRVHFLNTRACSFLDLPSGTESLETLVQRLGRQMPEEGAQPDLSAQALASLQRGESRSQRCDLTMGERTLRLEWQLHRLPHGRLFILLLNDIGERSRLEEHLNQIQKLEALGTLAGGVAHDFNNILAGMLGNLTLIRKQYQWLPDLVEQIGQIEALGFRGAEMVRQMMSFARQDECEKKPLALERLLADSIALARLSVPENIDFQFHCREQDLVVLANATQLQQLILNLINNARDALEHTPQPRLQLHLAHFHADTEFLSRHPQAMARDFALLTVEDNGCGMEPAVRERIFDPFFTTKENGKGTGLGLAMIYGVMRQLGGIIEVDSEPGQGSRFRLYFPLTDIILQDNEEGQQTTQVQTGNGEYILLVDDDDMVRESLQRMLESLGYHVIGANDGLAGLNAFCQHRDKIKLLITDAVMPSMNGDILACSIREINPGLPVIYSTAYDRAQVLDEDNRLEHSRVLGKPFTLEALASTVHALLHQPPPTRDAPRRRLG